MATGERGGGVAHHDALLAAGGLALAGGLVLGAAGLKLVGDRLVARLLCLLLVDGLHQDALVLVHVTLALAVQLVVEVPVDLLGVAVLAQQSAQHAQAAHPQQLGGQAGLAGTPALTYKHGPTTQRPRRVKPPAAHLPLSNELPKSQETH